MNIGRIAAMAAGIFLVGQGAVLADQVISDNVIVERSLCAGSSCQDGETFDFDTIRLKSDTPSIYFDDTSSSSSFPYNDWSVGVDASTTGEGHFYIDDATTDTRVLHLAPSGSVALGAASSLVDGAVSVGSPGNERRIVYLADAVDDTDAVNLRQFNDFKAEALNDLGTDVTQLDDLTSDLQAQLVELADRVEDLTARIDALD